MEVTTESSTTSADIFNALERFSNWYSEYHGYVAACVCVFGIVSNVVNSIVLTREKMFTPINCLLSALSIVHMLTLAGYLTWAIYLYITKEPNPLRHHSETRVVYILFNNTFVVTCQQMAMGLTVALGIFRYIIVCHHRRGPNLCSLKRAKITIVVVLVASVLISIPDYLNYHVIDLRDNPDVNLTGFSWFTYSYIKEQNDNMLANVNFWLYAIILKIVPCLLLVIMSLPLIRAMLCQKRRADDELGEEYKRTTAMVVAVVLFSVFIEFPHGWLTLLSAISVNIFDHYYVLLGDLIDIGVLDNSSVIFILYWIMSPQFRQTFKEVFHISSPPT